MCPRLAIKYPRQPVLSCAGFRPASDGGPTAAVGPLRVRKDVPLVGPAPAAAEGARQEPQDQEEHDSANEGREQRP